MAPSSIATISEKGAPYMIYYFTACTTLLSAVFGLCFSIGAVRSRRESGWTNALYMFSRSLALTGAALIPVCTGALSILVTVTVAMLIVQITDGIIGILIKSKTHTVGSFLMAVCHGVCLVLVA